MPFETFFSTLAYGEIAVTGKRNHEMVLENRLRLIAKFGGSKSVRLIPKHGDEIISVTKENLDSLVGFESSPEGDVLQTNQKELTMVCLAGDCPIYITYHPSGYLALIHAGRKGTLLDIVGKAINAGTNFSHESMYAAELTVHVSPAICGDHYQINYLNVSNPDKVTPFITGAFKVRGTTIKATHGTFGFDMLAYNKRGFVEAGVNPQNILEAPSCTYESDNYPSHYRFRQQGGVDERMLVLAKMTSS